MHNFSYFRALAWLSCCIWLHKIFSLSDLNTLNIPYELLGFDSPIHFLNCIPFELGQRCKTKEKLNPESLPSKYSKSLRGRIEVCMSWERFRSGKFWIYEQSDETEGARYVIKGVLNFVSEIKKGHMVFLIEGEVVKSAIFRGTKKNGKDGEFGMLLVW